MTRRDFLKSVVASSMYLAARRVFPAALAASPALPADVGIAVSADAEKATLRAIELAGGIRRFVSPGDVVVVKPNAGFNSPPSVRATTDPVVVRTVVHLCFQAGAAKVFVLDRSTTSTRLCYVTSGIARAAEEAGARIVNVDEVNDRNYGKTTVRDGFSLTETLVVRQVLECDALINVPVAKSHGSASYTLGMKNLMGISGDQRGRWHWAMHESIADINRIVTSHLTVIDAMTLMLRNGPTGGRAEDLKRIDTVIASANVLEADCEAAGLFGRKAADVQYLVLGAKAGVGRLSGYSVQKAGL
jgi:uncharacterized protein (DUF362 family)